MKKATPNPIKGQTRAPGLFTAREPGSVFLGSGSEVNLHDIPLVTFLRCIEQEVKARVSDERERKALLTKLRAISRDPAFSTLLTTSIGQLLTRLF